MELPLVSRWYRGSTQFWSHLLRRDAPESGTVVLGRRRVYILPTRSGVLFAAVLFAMLIGAINYSNSLAFALTFLLTGVALVSMVHTFRNLYQLRLRSGPPAAVFAGERARIPINLDNPSAWERLAVQLHFDGRQPVTVDIPEAVDRWVELELPTAGRGYLPLPWITIETRFPLGLFRAWGLTQLDQAILVYPTPATERGLPPELLRGGGTVGDQGSGHDDFAALRPYQSGDSLRHLHWKALAREQGLQTKQFGGNQVEQLWLHWDLLPNLTTEQRLSRLCRWVLEAEAAGLSYGLLLPGVEVEPARGEAHRRYCLKSLALFDLPRREH